MWTQTGSLPGTLVNQVCAVSILQDMARGPLYDITKSALGPVWCNGKAETNHLWGMVLADDKDPYEFARLNSQCHGQLFTKHLTFVRHCSRLFAEA